jgi:hypothetical protein
MRHVLMVAAVLLAARPTEARGVQLFNTEVLGEPTSKAVKLLVDRTADETEPYVIWSDIACGAYYAASVLYRRPVSFDETRSVLNRRYASFEVSSTRRQEPPFSASMGLWRVIDPKGTPAEQRGFSIQLTTDDDGVRVIYIAIGAASSVCSSGGTAR